MIPCYNFHWSALGARAAAAADIAGVRFDLPRAVAAPIAWSTQPSDLSQMVPGLDVHDFTGWPDYAAAGFDFCAARLDCAPDLGAIATTIGDISRAHSPRSGQGPLLLITDSFGIFIAPWFAEYFGDVRHISTNNFERLSLAARSSFIEAEIPGYAPNRVVFLYHGGALPSAARRVANLLWP